MKSQGIKNPGVGIAPRSQVCPIAQWVRKWVGLEDIGAGYDTVRVDDEGLVAYPPAVAKYIFYADSRENRS